MPQQKDIVKIAIQMPGAYPQLIQLDQVGPNICLLIPRVGIPEPSQQNLPRLSPGYAQIRLPQRLRPAAASCS